MRTKLDDRTSGMSLDREEDVEVQCSSLPINTKPSTLFKPPPETFPSASLTASNKPTFVFPLDRRVREVGEMEDSACKTIPPPLDLGKAGKLFRMSAMGSVEC